MIITPEFRKRFLEAWDGDKIGALEEAIRQPSYDLIHRQAHSVNDKADLVRKVARIGLIVGAYNEPETIFKELETQI